MEPLPSANEPVHFRHEETCHSLEGAVFPLSRSQALAIARENGASRAALTALHALPERRFDSLAALDAELGE